MRIQSLEADNFEIVSGRIEAERSNILQSCVQNNEIHTNRLLMSVLN